MVSSATLATTEPYTSMSSRTSSTSREKGPFLYIFQRNAEPPIQLPVDEEQKLHELGAGRAATIKARWGPRVCRRGGGRVEVACRRERLEAI